MTSWAACWNTAGPCMCVIFLSCVCFCVYLQSSVSLLYALAKFLKYRISLVLWILTQLRVLQDSRQRDYMGLQYGVV